MPTSPSVGDASTWAGWSAGALAIATLLIRFLMKQIRTDRLEGVTTDADVSLYIKLQKEISRLEIIIVAQQKRVDEFEARFDRLRDIELDDVADLATLTVLVSQMPCGRCSAPDEMYTQAHSLLSKIAQRRRDNLILIKGE